VPHQNGRKRLAQAKIAASSVKVVVEVGPGNGWLFKCCPRCHGDLFRNSYEVDWCCLVCGWGGPTARGSAAKVPREGRLQTAKAARSLRM
jgi:hypothetical protein